MTGNAPQRKDGSEGFGQRGSGGPGRRRRIKPRDPRGIGRLQGEAGGDEEKPLDMVAVGMADGDEIQPGQGVGREQRGNDVPAHVEAFGKEPSAVDERPASVGPFEEQRLTLSYVQSPQ